MSILAEAPVALRFSDRKRHAFIARALKTLPRGAHVLDVGCGNGHISHFLAERGFRVTGIDLSETAIQRARRQFDHPRLRFAVADAKTMALHGPRFDAIVCSEVLEHLHHPTDVLPDLYRALQPEGILVVTVPNGWGPRELLVTRPVQRLQGHPGAARRLRALKRALGYRGQTAQSDAGDLRHLQFFTRRRLEAMLQGAGFRQFAFGHSDFLADVFPLSLLVRRSTRLQALDGRLADHLPHTLTGNFFTAWHKADAHEEPGAGSEEADVGAEAAASSDAR